MARTSTLPKQLQPMLATLTDAPFDDKAWIFEDKYDGFRMVATIDEGEVPLYSRNGKIISQNYIEVAKALEAINQNAVIDGELVAIGSDGVSHFQLLQNARRREAKLQYCAFDLMFHAGDDLRGLPLLERKKRLKAILPKHKLIAFSRHRPTFGKKFFSEAERDGLEGIMAKRADSQYLSGARTDSWLKIKTSKRQEVVIAGFTAPNRTRPCFGALALAVREGKDWRFIGHVGTGFSHATLKERLVRTSSSRLRRWHYGMGISARRRHSENVLMHGLMSCLACPAARTAFLPGRWRRCRLHSAAANAFVRQANGHEARRPKLRLRFAASIAEPSPPQPN